MTLFLLVIAAGLFSQTAANEKISPFLLAAVESGEKLSLMISFRNSSTRSVLQNVETQNLKTREEKASHVSDALKKHSNRLHKNVFNILEKYKSDKNNNKFEVDQLWISGRICIKNAGPHIVKRLLACEEITEITKEEIYQIVKPLPGQTNKNSKFSLAAPEWGVVTVGAPAVWALGFNGTGIRVSSIDSGVDFTHPDLISNWIQGGWYDPTYNTQLPNDTNGHGTHTMGTMVGTGGTGVAPGAKWMTCLGCPNGACPAAALDKCCQWNINGTQYKPHVVSNSYGGSGFLVDTSMNSCIDALNNAGIAAVYAAGNDGPSCASISSPGSDEQTLAAGATDIYDRLANFSSRGPVVSLFSASIIQKPNYSAPGVNIRSTWTNKTYNTISGTSMATPHVAGVIALLLGANPRWSLNQLDDALSYGARLPPMTMPTCELFSLMDDNGYGKGIVNASKSIHAPV